MKTKSTLLALAFSAFSLSASAQRSPSHPMDIKTMDFLEWMNAFKSWEQGQPLQGVSRIDDEFYTSRVKPRKRIGESDGDYIVKTGLHRERKMCLWTPLDDPTSTWKAFPRYCFEGDNFSMWSYLDIHGNWTAPWVRVSAGLSDVAAKNGVKVGCLLSVPYSHTVIPSQYWRNDYAKLFYYLLEKGTDGHYKWTDKLVRFMKYYGVNGIGINSEFNSDEEGMQDILGFFEECHKKAEAIGWEFQVHWYDLMSTEGNISFANYLGGHNRGIFGEKDHKKVDMFFLNYNWSHSQLSNSARLAKTMGRSPYDVYAGFDIQGRALEMNAWPSLTNNEISIGFWGAHSQSLLHQSATDDGTSDLAIQKAYLQKQELVFSGGNRNPAATPEVGRGTTLANAALTRFHGLASFLTAKSTITTVPFVSRFNLGNGLKFRNEGKVTFDHKWYNLNTQDIMPTWRWWITDATDQVDASSVKSLVKADLTFDDAYFGGSCLRLHGQTAFSRVKLFKTMLDVQEDYTLSITYKMPRKADTHAKIFVALKDATSDYKEVEIPTDASKVGQWVTFTTTMSKLNVPAGSKVAMIGLSFANTPSDYNMLVGEIALRNPQQQFATVEPKVEEVQILRGRFNAIDFKMRYSCDNGTTGTKVYNDDVDVWYYEIYFQQENREQQLLTATTSWAAYVIDAPMVSGTEGRRARFGVRAVSPDGKHGTKIVWTAYQAIPYDQPLSDVVTDKQVIKPNEPFTLKMLDEMVQPAQRWEVRDPQTNAVVATADNSSECKVTVDHAGLYDLYLTDAGGVKHITRGKVLVTPEATGSVPTVDAVSVDKNQVKTGDRVTYSYTGKKGEGKVSRALEVKDPNMFMVPADVQKGMNYSYALWFKADKFSHDKDGTNLISKNTIHDKWPHNNWGDLWVQIRPTWKTHKANEVSFNTMGWEDHNDPKPDMMSTDYQVTPGVWTHIVVTQQGTHQKLYFNGVKVADANFAGSLRRETRGDYRIQTGQPANIFIGGGGVYKAAFSGLIDEVQVWDKALSDEEVREAMKGYAADQIPANLQAYYTFEKMEADGTFLNYGKAGADKVGKIVVMKNSGGENTSKASYEQQQAFNDFLGYPGIVGSKEIKTTTEWTLANATIQSTGDVAVVSYLYGGSYKGSVTLENEWGKASKTLEGTVEVEGTTNSIDGVDAELGFSVYPNPFVESVNLRFAEGGDYTIQVLNASGALLQTTKAQPSAGQIVNVTVTGNNGLYLVRVLKNGKHYKAVKVIKQ